MDENVSKKTLLATKVFEWLRLFLWLLVGVVAGKMAVFIIEVLLSINLPSIVDTILVAFGVFAGFLINRLEHPIELSDGDK